MKPSNPIETEREYRKALAGHDWFFAFADDGSVWRKGQAHRSRILAAAKTLDPQYKIWDEYAPEEMKVRVEVDK